MARVLVVDDSDTDRLLVAEILREESDLEFLGIDDGRKALDLLAEAPPDMVLTDLIMPGMDGFEVVAAVRKSFPAIPIVLMTSMGNEEIAVRALREGASSYVPKRNLTSDLIPTIRDVLRLAGRQRAEERILETLTRSELSFRLNNHQELVLPLVRHLQGVMCKMGLCDDAELTQVGVALSEALSNAIEHGNLEVEAELRETDLAAHGVLMKERRGRSPFCERRVTVKARLTRDEARFTVRDEGPGFDPATLPDPRDPEHLERVHGRGVLLIRSFMDEVIWNDRGNEVTLVKRREA